MKITEGSYSSADTIVDKARRKLTAVGSGESPEARIPETIPESQQRIAHAQRAIARDQLLLGALEQLARRLDAGRELDTFLPELIDATRMGGERVLEPHGAVLHDIAATGDRARLDELIHSRGQAISQAMARLVKDETALQNRAAAVQARGTGDLPALLKRVVEDLRSSGGAEFHLKRGRVLDLLG